MSLTMPLLRTFLLRPSLHLRARVSTLVVGLALFAVIPEDLLSQAPEQRLDLERFRDSIGGTVDSSGLLALERRMIDSAKSDRSNGMIHLKLGFVSLRLGDLGG